MTIGLSEEARCRAHLAGPSGAAWLAGLDGLVRDLAAEWGLSALRPLPGGTAAFVAEARMADGRPAVLKLAVPGLDPAAGGLRTLLLAEGRGYARLYRHDCAREAMLLERLGGRLADLGLPVEAQIDALCTALLQAWRPLPEGEGGFMTGAEKADSLAAFIRATWRDLGRPCTERAVDTACRFAEARRRAWDPAAAILAHGDAHAWNTLAVPGEPGRFKFVDPEGLFIERAYDLGISLREWGADLLAGDAVALGQARCLGLARRTGVAPGAIWQWGFIERVSTGLVLLQLGLRAPGREFLQVADLWAATDPPGWAQA
ncbi:aminoglycoside phosphotransferase family protein [Inquilinus sp.]|jgi:streptomycin 6-kinase|uniref:aminoglycoside phosphotransferase family protein n=1 Tax=Inquilinus sp. TaxID=1932117 RepID=UPI0037844C6B